MPGTDGKGSDLRQLIQAAESLRAWAPWALADSVEAGTVSRASWVGHTPLLGQSLFTELEHYLSHPVFTVPLETIIMDFAERIIMFTQLCICSRLRTLFRFEHWRSLMRSAFQHTSHAVPLPFLSRADSLLPSDCGLSQCAENLQLA